MSKTANIKPALLRILSYVIALLVTNLAFAGIFGKLASLGKMENAPLLNLTSVNIVTGITASFVAALLTVGVFRRYVDKKTMASLGLRFSGQSSNAATGFFTALFILGCGTLVLVWGNHLYWVDVNAGFGQLMAWALLMLAVALGEELAFRGYILNNLLQAMNRWWALAISAAIFSLFHGYNPETSALALINIFLAGILLGINYVYTRNLWFGILFHFTWNYYQGPILGFPISGLQLSSLLTHEVTGNSLITGGGFGFENSILYTVLSVMATVALVWSYKEQDEV